MYLCPKSLIYAVTFHSQLKCQLYYCYALNVFLVCPYESVNITNHEQLSTHLNLHQPATSPPVSSPNQNAMLHLLVDVSYIALYLAGCFSCLDGTSAMT